MLIKKIREDEYGTYHDEENGVDLLVSIESSVRNESVGKETTRCSVWIMFGGLFHHLNLTTVVSDEDECGFMKAIADNAKEIVKDGFKSLTISKSMKIIARERG